MSAANRGIFKIMTILPYNKNLQPYARQLRKKLTDTELILWAHLRKKQIKGIQFYRQKALGNFIVDFYAPSVKLIIEVDGSQHYEPSAVEQDLSRDTYLSELQLYVLRFDNNQVRQSLNSVLEAIRNYIENYLR